jgi:AcrR family transcriptional regulator
MTTADFQRARSPEAKRARETAILNAARTLGARAGIRQVTLTDIADETGMHKSAMLRYFETREEIFLRLTADGWREWTPVLCEQIAAASAGGPAGSAGSAGSADSADSGATDTASAVAAAFASTLAARGAFCDLLAQAPLNLERNVSLDAVRTFKLTTRECLDRIVATARAALPGLTDQDAVDLVATATSLAGTFWQIATPSDEVAALYRSDPRMSHALIDVEPRLERILTALLQGQLALAGAASRRVRASR